MYVSALALVGAVSVELQPDDVAGLPALVPAVELVDTGAHHDVRLPRFRGRCRERHARFLAFQVPLHHSAQAGDVALTADAVVLAGQHRGLFLRERRGEAGDEHQTGKNESQLHVNLLVVG